MNRQEMFNRAYIGVMRQGELASKNGVCQYYIEETGCRCGIGHVLEPDQAKAWSENDKFGTKTIGKIICETEPSSLPDYMHDGNYDFLSDLQHAHDQISVQPEGVNMSDFHISMTNFAERYSLTIPERI